EQVDDSVTAFFEQFVGHVVVDFDFPSLTLHDARAIDNVALLQAHHEAWNETGDSAVACLPHDHGHVARTHLLLDCFPAGVDEARRPSSDFDRHVSLHPRGGRPARALSSARSRMAIDDAGLVPHCAIATLRSTFGVGCPRRLPRSLGPTRRWYLSDSAWQ